MQNLCIQFAEYQEMGTLIATNKFSLIHTHYYLGGAYIHSSLLSSHLKSDPNLRIETDRLTFKFNYYEQKICKNFHILFLPWLLVEKFAINMNDIYSIFVC